jgi:carbon monoxide dehydrogenase subunit G
MTNLTGYGTAARPRAGRMAAAGALLLLLLPVAGAAGVVTVEVDSAAGSCGVRGRFHVALPPPAAWAVVTDYDHIPEFVPSMVSSRTERQPDGRLLVRQTAKGGVFIFRRRVNVLLELEEEPGRRIGFRDVLGKDFKHYVGEWRIEADSLGTNVRYALEAEPKSVPRALCRSVLRRTAKDLLQQVRVEILRRAAAPAESGEASPQ